MTDPPRPEIIALYELLAEALPHAYHQLRHGGVTNLNQMGFWEKIDTVMHYCDFLDFDDDGNAILNDAGFHNRLQDLYQAWEEKKMMEVKSGGGSGNAGSLAGYSLK